MAFEVIFQLMKKVCLNKVSILSKFNQNRFLNECARKNLAKIKAVKM